MIKKNDAFQTLVLISRPNSAFGRNPEVCVRVNVHFSDISLRSAESEQRLDGHARSSGLVLLVLLHLHELPLALALLLPRCFRSGHFLRVGPLLFLQHPEGLDDIPGFRDASGGAAVLVGVHHREVREAGLWRRRNVGEIAEIREEVTAANRLRFRISVIVRAATTVIVRIVEALVHRVLVVLLVLRIISTAADHAEITRPQYGLLVLGRGGLIIAVALEVAYESVGTISLLLLFRERESVIRKELRKGREEVLTLGFQISAPRVGKLRDSSVICVPRLLILRSLSFLSLGRFLVTLIASVG